MNDSPARPNPNEKLVRVFDTEQEPEAIMVQGLLDSAGIDSDMTSVDAIQEFNLQSQFATEYGRNSGSVVNIVTRSGTNHFHGSAFEFLRNSALDARNYFNTESRKSVFQNNNFGAAFGMPNTISPPTPVMTRHMKIERLSTSRLKGTSKVPLLIQVQ